MQTDTMPSAPQTLMAPGLASDLAPDLSWQQDALCAQAGPEFFFPAPGSSTREAKLLCGACEGRVACLEYALKHDERFGVWGGLSEKERIKLKRRRG